MIFLSPPSWSFILLKTVHVKLPRCSSSCSWSIGFSRLVFNKRTTYILTAVCAWGEMDIYANQYDILFSFKRSECPSLMDVAFSLVPCILFRKAGTYRRNSEPDMHILLYPRTTFSPKGRPRCWRVRLAYKYKSSGGSKLSSFYIKHRNLICEKSLRVFILIETHFYRYSIITRWNNLIYFCRRNNQLHDPVRRIGEWQHGSSGPFLWRRGAWRQNSRRSRTFGWRSTRRGQL